MDTKHPDKNDFRVMESMETWMKFKASVIHLTDKEKKSRLCAFVDSTTDPLAAKVRYHLKCFLKYMNPIYHPKSDEHLQGMTIADMKNKFVYYVYQSIFENGEARTLQNLTTEYERIRLDFGVFCWRFCCRFWRSVVRLSHVRDILTKEFGDRIGFHDRYHKNSSTIVFNSEETGSYIESAINFWGFKTEDILKAAAIRIKVDLKEESQFPFPPKLADLTNMHERVTTENSMIENF